VKPPPKCHWNADLGWLSPEHLADCKAPECAGCRPCGKTHCAMRGRCANHVEAEAGIITCPGCIGQVRRDLATVEELHALVGDEAEYAGLDSEAANLAGPAASPDQVAGRKAHGLEWLVAEHLADCKVPDCPGCRPDLHPYRVLGDWDLALREQYGPQTDLFVTVGRARDYLTTLLAGPFPHGDEFEGFASSIAACRAHLEAVLHDSRAPERGRPCPRCVEAGEEGKGPRLRKRYARHPKLKGKRCPTPGVCETCKGTNDTWHCPDIPEHWWSERDYRDRVASDFVDHATHLAAPDLAERVGVSLSTVRKWTARKWDKGERAWIPPRLASHRRGADGRKVYPVKDALRLAGKDDPKAGPSVGNSVTE